MVNLAAFPTLGTHEVSRGQFYDARYEEDSPALNPGRRSG
jgi:hypothetical protein